APAARKIFLAELFHAVAPERFALAVTEGIILVELFGRTLPDVPGKMTGGDAERIHARVLLFDNHTGQRQRFRILLSKVLGDNLDRNFPLGVLSRVACLD